MYGSGDSAPGGSRDVVRSGAGDTRHRDAPAFARAGVLCEIPEHAMLFFGNGFGVWENGGSVTISTHAQQHNICLTKDGSVVLVP